MHKAMGQKPVPPVNIPILTKIVVHLPQNGTIGFDPQPYDKAWQELAIGTSLGDLISGGIVKFAAELIHSTFDSPSRIWVYQSEFRKLRWCPTFFAFTCISFASIPKEEEGLPTLYDSTCLPLSLGPSNSEQCPLLIDLLGFVILRRFRCSFGQPFIFPSYSNLPTGLAVTNCQQKGHASRD